jgi:hypothetical protein
MSALTGDAHQLHPVLKLDRLKAGAEHECCMWLQLALNLSKRPATIFIPLHSISISYCTSL